MVDLFHTRRENKIKSRLSGYLVNDWLVKNCYFQEVNFNWDPCSIDYFATLKHNDTRLPDSIPRFPSIKLGTWNLLTGATCFVSFTMSSAMYVFVNAEEI